MPKIGAAHHSTGGEDVIMPRPSAVVSASEQAMSIKYNTMVYEMTRAGQKVIVMSLGEAFFDIPLFPMDDLPHPAVYHYSHSRGIPELREKLAGHFKKAYDVPIDPESEILITAGSKAAIHMALMSILDPGDEVLIHEPTWVSYPEQIKLCYGKPVRIPLDAAIRDYEKYVTRKTKAVIVNTPHNPSGYVWSESDLGYVLDLAKTHNLWVLSDEAYSEFVTTDTFVSLGALDPEKRHSIIFNSISKNYGISGWRMGYVIANKVLTDQILKVNQHLITCPPTILEYYISKHFDRILDITRPQIRAVVEQRAQLSRYMKEIGLDHMPGTATFYFFVSIAPSKLGSEEFATSLLQNDLVSTVPGLGYGNSCDKYIRVSIGTMSLDDNSYGLRKIKELIEKTS
jgi:aspartate aminotransferase/aminotransferase